jgi:hypothetical protein
MTDENEVHEFLPEDVSILIFSFLDTPSALKFGRTCKDMFKFSEIVWEKYHNLSYGNIKEYHSLDWRNNFLLKSHHFLNWKDSNRTLKPFKKEGLLNFYTPTIETWKQLGATNLFLKGFYSFHFRLMKYESKELQILGIGVFDFRVLLHDIKLDFGITEEFNRSGVYFPCTHFKNGDIFTVQIDRFRDEVSIFILRDEIYTLLSKLNLPTSHEQLIFAATVEHCELTTVLKHHFYL